MAVKMLNGRNKPDLAFFRRKARSKIVHLHSMESGILNLAYVGAAQSSAKNKKVVSTKIGEFL